MLAASSGSATAAIPACRSRFTSAIVLLSSICRASIAADTWPLFRGDRLATGVAPGALPEKLEVLWKFQAGKEGGFEATAVIADGIGLSSARWTATSTRSI